MILGLSLYRLATRCLSPYLSAIMRRRARQGKENSNRIHERLGRSLPERPEGQLFWFHGASVGESMIILEIAAQLVSKHPKAACLFTCQTLTGADTITNKLENDPRFEDIWTCQQMAPVDTPAIARRFVSYWQPDLAVFAEGEIWQNLLHELKHTQTRTALVNARMTEKSISGWRRWPDTAKHVFSLFDVILAANKKVAVSLSSIRGETVPCPGNLKSALPIPDASTEDEATLRQAIGERSILVAASTHTGEEALVLDALLQMSPRPFAIIAPRHPERGDEVESLLSCSYLKIARRSRNDPVTPDTNILLADTLGELGIWYRLATAVYLGGGHSPGVGGHNPLEPIRLGKPVMTGPSVFNFEDMAARLESEGGLTVVNTVEDLVTAFPCTPPTQALLRKLDEQAIGPMSATITALTALLAHAKEEA